MSKKKELWFTLNDKTSVEILSEIFNLTFSTILFPFDLLELLKEVKLPQRMGLAAIVDSIEDVDTLAQNPHIWERTKCLLSKDRSLLEALQKDKSRSTGLYAYIKDRVSLDATVNDAAMFDVVVVEFKDPTNIPLELILADTQTQKTKILKMVEKSEDGEVSLLTMEKGCDGIVLMDNSLTEAKRLSGYLEKTNEMQFDLKPAEVTGIKHVEMGERVCIDTTSELTQHEGMLLGSSSSGGLLVCSETHYLPYMNLRPFRVNAGSLHMYIWGPDNFVVYLSDLRAGDKVYAVESSGRARPVTVGRLKIERRPLMMIEALIEGVRVNTFIQDDWHVRMFGHQGEIRPSSEIKLGDKLLGFLDKPGRHVGISINETIKEL